LLGYLHPVFPVVVVVTGFLCSVAIAVWYGLRNLATYLARAEDMFEGLQDERWWRKVMACILGYRTELSKLRSTFYLYPMEEVVQGTESPHRALKLYIDAETDREPLVSDLSDSLAKLGYEGKVWVTPGIPMLLFILIGLILTLILGDIVFSTVFILARG
jgi:prepilin signal peptidase PulO-like enzyme (type II secretory pathway)